MDLLVFLGLLAVGYGSGQYFEKKHYKNLVEREGRLRLMPVITGEWRGQIGPDEEGTLVGSGVVIGSDYFKTVVAGLRSIVGGRLKVYESLLDRGRREAVLRMKENANNWNADRIINMRIETANINSAGGRRGFPCIELYAYGTAIRKIEDAGRPQ